MGLKPRSGAQRKHFRRHKKKAWMRDFLACQKCGVKLGYSHADFHHILPRSKGGTDEVDNLVTVCRPCHVGLHSVDPNGNTRGAVPIGGVT